MKITLNEVVCLRTALVGIKLTNKTLSGKSLYWLRRNLDLTEKQETIWDDARKAALDKYAKKDETGKFVSSPDGNIEFLSEDDKKKYVDELNELGESAEDIPLHLLGEANLTFDFANHPNIGPVKLNPFMLEEGNKYIVNKLISDVS